MAYIYSFFISVYTFILLLVSPFNRKAKLIVRGRKNSFKTLKEKINKDDKVAWFHAASLGEFEQGRPLIESFRKDNPSYKILLSFFSSSGYEIRKNYDGADIVIYLPSDSRRNVRRFIKLAHPEYVFFIKYEFWYNFIRGAKQSGAKLFQVSLILRPNQYFFSPFGSWYRKQLKNFDYFFVQNQETKDLLDSIGFRNSKVTGDTRFDRVAQIASEAKSFEKIREFCQGDNIVLMGSSWPKDEYIIKEVFNKTKSEFKLIIAPHEIHPSHIEDIKALFPDAIKYSEIKKRDYKNIGNKDKILIIDNIGILSSLYKYASLAYIGGGFGEGIHNILEAATFGKPILFGPNYQKFKEARDLVEKEAAFSFTDKDKLVLLIDNLLLDSDYYKKSSDTCLRYILDNKGACQRILSKILLLMVAILFVGCSPYKHISKEGYLLSKNKVLVDTKALPKSDFSNLIKQDPNTLVLGMKLGMRIYSLSPSGEDSTVSFLSRNLIRKIGQKPVEFEKDYAHRSTQQMKNYLKNKGCFDGNVRDSISYKKREARVSYYIETGQRYKIDTFFISSKDKALLESAISIMASSPIKKGIYYDEDLFVAERNRLTNDLNKSGYYDFTSDYILFNIDTNNNNYTTNINLNIENKRLDIEIDEDDLVDFTNTMPRVFKKYKIRNIYVYPDIAYQQILDTNTRVDTNIIFHRQKDKYGLNKYYVIYSPPESMKIKTILRTVMFQRDSLYSPIYAEGTYNAINQLKNFKFIDISYSPILLNSRDEVLDTSLLDCFIKLSLTKPVLLTTSLETNFSAVNNSLLASNNSNFGMELNAGIQHKNIFKGAEIFSFNGKTAFEIKSDIFSSSIDTINKWSLVNALEAGFDFGIEIPRFLMPFGTNFYSMQFLPHTTIKTGYNFQKRNYFERSIFNLNFGYSWNYLTKYSHAIIPIEINLVKMNVTNQYYSDYIKTLDKRIRYQYSDHLVTNSRYSFMYNGQELNKKRDFNYIRFNIESAGNLIYLVNNLANDTKNDLDQYTIFGIPYAQYLRTDIDFKKYHYIGENQVFVFRAYGGIGIPYGNSSGLPYEKSFFSGGNNNHRAWELRELGPGSSKIDDSQLRYDRSGDIQLGANFEYRWTLLGPLEGAAFIDIGNVWTLYDQKDMQGGQIQLNSFYKELATGLGLGIRLNIQILIFRFDFAVKAWDPSKPIEERWVIPQTKFNSINMNFGIGYPF